MIRKQNYIVSMLLFLLFMSGCGQKLSEKEASFTGNSLEYTIQLPDSWKKTTNYQTKFNESAVFGAEDTKSKSQLYVLVDRKNKINTKEFGKEMQQEIAIRYGYKKASDIYFKEEKKEDKTFYKYTLRTNFDKQNVWLHLYYVESANGMVQVVIYSGNDGNYKKRSEMLHESLLTLQEIKDLGEDESFEKPILFENQKISLELIGVMPIQSNQNNQMVALRYKVTNKQSEEAITPEKWNQLIKVKQADQELEQAALPEDNPILDLSKLLDQRTETIASGQMLDSVTIYSLKTDQPIELVPTEAIFQTNTSQLINVPKIN